MRIEEVTAEKLDAVTDALQSCTKGGQPVGDEPCLTCHMENLIREAADKNEMGGFVRAVTAATTQAIMASFSASRQPGSSPLSVIAIGAARNGFASGFELGVAYAEAQHLNTLMEGQTDA